MQKEVVLVTGASGFVGSNLVEHLINKNAEVRVLLRKGSQPSNLDGLDIKKVMGDYRDVESLREAVEGVDYVYHCAGAIKSATGEKGYYEGNVMPTKNLLQAVSQYAKNIKRFVHVSSLSASGPAASLTSPLVEDTEERPISLYGKSKLESEKVAKAFMNELPITIVRPSIVYGEKDLEMLMPFQAVSKGYAAIVGVREAKYLTFIYIKDLVEGMVLAAKSENSKNKTYFLTDSTPYTHEEFYKTIQERLKKKGVFLLHIPEVVSYIPAFFVEVFIKLTGKPMILTCDKIKEMRQTYWVCSGEKAKREFGFENKFSLGEGVEKTIAWAKSKKLI